MPCPGGASAPPIKRIMDEADKIGIIDNVLLYAPDAIGERLFQDYREWFEPVIQVAPIQITILSMSPSYTPVCYGSMFTGLQPNEHGITRYNKPVLKCETLFDVTHNEGKKVAIVAVENSSIDLIFRGRDIQYYSELDDDEVEERVFDILGVYNLIVAYNQGYDDTMHNSTPRSPESIEAFRKHIETFKRMGEAFNTKLRDENRVIAFLPDHGTHIDIKTGKGAHGTDSPEDMDVRHFWGIYRGEPTPGNVTP
jgi:hypothetical protein